MTMKFPLQPQARPAAPSLPPGPARAPLATPTACSPVHTMGVSSMAVIERAGLQAGAGAIRPSLIRLHLISPAGAGYRRGRTSSPSEPSRNHGAAPGAAPSRSA